MDSSESPTYGEQEGSAYNGHFACTCYHPLFVFNQFGDVERCTLRPGNVHSADGWRALLEPVVAGYGAMLGGAQPQAAAAPLLRPIPSTGELLPAVGMGSWITFNVGEDAERRDQRVEVLREFFAAGGTVINSSPMYGSSEAVIGYGLERLGDVPLFAATKVWTPLAMLGPGSWSARARCGGSSGSTSCRSTTCWPGRGISRRCSRTRQPGACAMSA